MTKDLDPEDLVVGIGPYIRKLAMTKAITGLYITRVDCLQFVTSNDRIEVDED